MYKRLYFIGIAAYVIMMSLSVIYYKERIIILDTAFSLFNILRTTNFSLYASRCGALFSQVIPVLAAKAGTSVETAVLCYSIGFTAYYFVCYILCGFVFKRYEIGLVLLFFHILFVADTFYYIPSELSQGVNFLMVGLAAIQAARKKSVWVYRIIFFTVSIGSAFFHPLMSVVIGYTALFFYLQQRQLFERRELFLLVGIYACGFIINNLFFRIDYDRAAMSGVKNFIKLFPDYFTLYSDQQFLKDIIRKYYFIPFGFVCVAGWYAYTRKWQMFSLFICSFLGYLLLVNVSYPTASTPVVYMENQYLPMAMILAYPIVFDLLPVLDRKRIALPFLLAVIGISSARFYVFHTAYSARLDYERKYLDKYGEQKVIVKATDKDKEMLQLLWGTPYEFLLLSESERHKPASIIIDDTPFYRYWAPDIRNALLVNWNVYPYYKLDQRYFHFTDTVSGYAIIK